MAITAADNAYLLQLTEQLERAIVDGDADMAKAAAAQLAGLRVAVSIHCIPPPMEKEINVKIFVEDKQASGSFVHWYLHPSMTIKALKHLVFLSYQFPPKIQCWIAGGQLITNENVTLRDCGINKPNSVMYLYLVSVNDSADQAVLDIPELDVQEVAFVEPPLEQQRLETAIHLGLGLEQNVPEDVPLQAGWCCSQCTYINEPTRPGCEMCATDRPKEYNLPVGGYKLSAKERERLEREETLEALTKQSINFPEFDLKSLEFAQEQKLVPNTEAFECPICLRNIDVRKGVVLRECVHSFCGECLADYVRLSDEADVKCPFDNGEYQCAASMQEIEIRAIVTPEVFQRYLRSSMLLAERQAPNSFHCQTPDCVNWCLFEDEVNFFLCPACKQRNCLTCKAIHNDQTCKDYQEDLKRRANNDEAAKKTIEMLEKMVQNRDAMYCPTCHVIVTKKTGCDWLQCSMCKTEICWVTKGPRWGPGGTGDTSGGCKCHANGAKCHPQCGNCH